MKNIVKYCGLLFLALFVATSCEDATVGDDETIDYGTAPIVTGFVNTSEEFGVSTDGEIKVFHAPVQAMGANINDLSADVTVTYSVNEAASTAEAGVHYLPLESNSITLTADQNYIGSIPISFITEGQTAPSSVNLVLNIESVQSSDSDVVVSGNTNQLTIELQYLCFSDMAGEYAASVGPTASVTLTETGVGIYEMSALPGLSAGGQPIPFEIKENCGQLTINTIVLGGYLVIGQGEVYADGSFDINGYILYNGTTIDSGPFFDNSNEVYSYTPMP